MIQLQLQPEIEAELAAKAEARGLGVADFVQNIVAERLADDNFREEADAVEGIRRGLADAAAGRTRPAHEVFAELDREYGLHG